MVVAAAVQQDLMSSTPSRRRTPPSHAVNVFLFLLAFRLLNALAVQTFFQPDEFFQSLEPAWQIAFGKDQGAWITWVSASLHRTTYTRAVL